MKYFILISAFTFFSFTLFAQTRDETAIRTVMDTQVKAWNNGNIGEFMQTYWKSDSVVFVGSNGPNYGWKTTFEHYKQRYPDTTSMGKLDFDILQIKLLSNEYGFVLGKFHLARSIGDLSGYFTLLFRKLNGQWLIVVDHTS